MLAKLFPATFRSCVLWVTLADSVENLKGVGFGVGVFIFATAAVAFKNQFARTKFASSGVCTGGLCTRPMAVGADLGFIQMR